MLLNQAAIPEIKTDEGSRKRMTSHKNRPVITQNPLTKITGGEFLNLLAEPTRK